MKRTLHSTGLVALLFAAALALSGCLSTSSTSTDTATAVDNAVAVAAPLVEGGARIAVPMILVKNPSLAEEFGAISTAAGTILAASDPTAEGFAIAIRAAAPDLTAAQAAQIGAALESAYKSAAALFQAQTGKPLSLTALIADTRYKAAADKLVDSLVAGIAGGLADYRAATAPAG